MELEFHGVFFFEKFEKVSESFKKIGTKNLEVENYGIF
jgi:hypothetical protein